MIWFLSLALASDTPCDPNAALKVLQGAEGDLKTAYLCLAGDEVGDDLLAAALDVTGATPATAPTTVVIEGGRGVVPAPKLDDDAVHARLTRALTLWFLQHNEQQWDPMLVRRLPAVDRRLLADGVKARRGRASPAPEHAKVFANFDWYAPIATYTDGRLTPLDLEHIAVANKPPPAPPPVAPAPPEVAAAPVVAAEPAAWCGCTTGTSANAAGWLVGAAALITRRRRSGGGASGTRAR